MWQRKNAGIIPRDRILNSRWLLKLKQTSATSPATSYASILLIYWLWPSFLFYGKGKSAGQTVLALFDEVMPAFTSLSSQATRQIIQWDVEPWQRFVVLLYDRYNACTSVNDARLPFLYTNGKITGVYPQLRALCCNTQSEMHIKQGFVVVKPSLPTQPYPAIQRRPIHGNHLDTDVRGKSIMPGAIEM